ncbi:hypothetical protein G7046_g8796 [Stylonectria norvegica]|nr:hypothetical protein G7046_g8796 [Stylonectria norvegica]
MTTRPTGSSPPVDQWVWLIWSITKHGFPRFPLARQANHSTPSFLPISDLRLRLPSEQRRRRVEQNVPVTGQAPADAPPSRTGVLHDAGSHQIAFQRPARAQPDPPNGPEPYSAAPGRPADSTDPLINLMIQITRPAFLRLHPLYPDGSLTLPAPDGPVLGAPRFLVIYAVPRPSQKNGRENSRMTDQASAIPHGVLGHARAATKSGVDSDIPFRGVFHVFHAKRKPFRSPFLGARTAGSLSRPTIRATLTDTGESRATGEGEGGVKGQGVGVWECMGKSAAEGGSTQSAEAAGQGYVKSPYRYVTHTDADIAKFSRRLVVGWEPWMASTPAAMRW